MKPSGLLWLLVPLAGGLVMSHVGCADNAASGMTITVQKWDSVNDCFATMPVGDAAGPGVPAATCPGATTTNLVAGVDLVRMVISYGDLSFNSSTAPPPPTISMTLDGADTPPAADITLAQASGPTVFYAVLPAPVHIVDQMLLAATVASGFSHPPIGPFAVTEPAVAVDVQECASDAGLCSFGSGVGAATVTAVAPGMVATTGTATWTLGGVLQAGSAPIAMAPMPGADNMLQGTAFIPVPAAPQGTPWVVSVQVGGATGSGPTATLIAPEVTVGIEQCGGDAGACTLTADVGTVAVSVSTPGTLAQTGTVVSSLDGVQQPARFSVQLAPATNQTLQGVVYVPVPAAAGGSQWSLSAQVGTAMGYGPPVTLRAPAVTASLSGCTQAICTVSAGASVLVTVTVPLAMSVQQATVTTSVSGAPDLTPVTVALTSLDITAGTLSGSTAITAPGQAGATWLIDANAGGYLAPTLTATVQ